MDKQVQNIKKQLHGFAKFPGIDDQTGKFTAKVVITENDVEKLITELEPLGEELKFSDNENLEINEDCFEGFNVKTGFKIPVFDMEGNRLDNEKEPYPIYDGAECVFQINFKPYTYKQGRVTKHGVTGYLTGAMVIKQGTPYQAETTFEDFKSWLDDETLQF